MSGANFSLRLQRHVTRSYGSLHNCAVTPIWESDGQGVYRVGETRVVRVFDRDRPLERVEGDGAVLEFVERHGIPAERLVRSADGRRSTSLDGHGVIVTTFVVGTSPALDPESLRRLGEAAGRIAALRVGEEPFVERTAGSLPAEDLVVARGELSSAPVSRETEELVAALAGTSDCQDLPRGFVHPDVFPGNAIRTPRGEVTLIDWTGVGCGPRIATLGSMLYATAAHSRGGDGPDLARLRPLLEGYCQHHVLTAAELDRLPDAVTARPLALAVRQFIKSGQSPWPFRRGHVASVVDEARRILN